MQPKKFGELCEMEFAIEAMRRNLIVSKPMIEGKYDFIVDNGEKRLRIQVKSTNSVAKTDRKQTTFGIMISHGSSSKKLYNENQIDFFAIYIAPMKLWYFIPVSFINCSKVSLVPSSKNSKYNQFKNAWHLIQ